MMTLSDEVCIGNIVARGLENLSHRANAIQLTAY